MGGGRLPHIHPCTILPVGFTYCTTSLHLPYPKLELLLSIEANEQSTSQIIDYHAPFLSPQGNGIILCSTPLPTAAAVIWNNLSLTSSPSLWHPPTSGREGPGQEIITKSISYLSCACVVKRDGHAPDHPSVRYAYCRQNLCVNLCCRDGTENGMRRFSYL